MADQVAHLAMQSLQPIEYMAKPETVEAVF